MSGEPINLGGLELRVEDDGQALPAGSGLLLPGPPPDGRGSSIATLAARRRLDELRARAAEVAERERTAPRPNRKTRRRFARAART